MYKRIIEKLKNEQTLEYRGYTTNIKYDVDDNIFYGKINKIHDLVDFNSNTFDGVKEAFKLAVEDYIIFCKVNNKVPEKPRIRDW